MSGLTLMEINLLEILPNFYSTEILFFARVKYNPLPLFAGVLVVGLIISFVTLPFVRAAGDENQKKIAFNFYFGVGFFSLFYGVPGLLYAAFVWVSRQFGSDSFGKELLWFDSLVSLALFLLGLTVCGLLLTWLAEKIRPPRNGSGKSTKTAETDFTSLKLDD